MKTATRNITNRATVVCAGTGRGQEALSASLFSLTRVSALAAQNPRADELLEERQALPRRDLSSPEPRVKNRSTRRSGAPEREGRSDPFLLPEVPEGWSERCKTTRNHAVENRETLSGIDSARQKVAAPHPAKRHHQPDAARKCRCSNLILPVKHTLPDSLIPGDGKKRRNRFLSKREVRSRKRLHAADITRLNLSKPSFKTQTARDRRPSYPIPFFPCGTQHDPHSADRLSKALRFLQVPETTLS